MDLENPYWEIDPKTHSRKDKQTGQAVTGRQQVPDACVPDRSLAIGRPDELLVLGEKLRSGMVHGFRVPPAGMRPPAGRRCEEATRAGECAPTFGAPGKGGLAEARESFEKLMKSPEDASGESVRECQAVIRDLLRQAATGLETMHNIKENALRLERAAGGYRQSFQCIHEGHAKALRQYHAALELEDRFSRFEESRKAKDGLALIESGEQARGFNVLRDILAAFPNSEVATEGLRGLAASGSPEAGEAAGLLAEYRCEIVDEISTAFADKAIRLAGGNNPPWLFVSDRRDIHRLTLDGEYDKSFGLNLDRPPRPVGG